MSSGQPSPDEGVADRLIRKAMEDGEFENLPGMGEPLPGAGTVDDGGWWIRSWVKRNLQPDSDDDA